MRTKDKTREQLISELEETHQRIAELEASMTKHKQMKEKIRCLATVLHDSNDAITIQNFNGKIITWNRGAEQMYGYIEAEALKMNIHDIVPKTKREEGIAFVQKLKRGGAVESFETQRITKDGRILDIWLTVTKLVDEEGKSIGFATTEHDITERKKMQAQLMQAETLSAIGMMATGVAHELLNPMMGMINFTQYCQEHTAKDDSRHAVLQDIERETRRCADIVNSLLIFSRTGKQGEKYQRESLATIIDRVVRLLSYRIEKQHVSLTQHIDEGTPEVWMEPNSLQQVFLNLISNALYAVEDSEKKEICIEAYQEGDFIQVTVADSGCGITPENLKNIYYPFFTTKPVGQGTGLGLTISRSIIESHGGDITCESRSGVGTTFTILLPFGKKEGQNE